MNQIRNLLEKKKKFFYWFILRQIFETKKKKQTDNIFKLFLKWVDIVQVHVLDQCHRVHRKLIKKILKNNLFGMKIFYFFNEVAVVHNHQIGMVNQVIVFMYLI